MAKDSTVKERLAILETLLTNHLHHHEIYLTCVLLPCLVAALVSAGGVIFTIIKLIAAKVI